MKYRVGDIIETGSLDIPGHVTFLAKIQYVDPDRGSTGQYHVVPEPGEVKRVEQESDYPWGRALHRSDDIRSDDIGPEPGWWVTEEEVVGAVSLKDSAERILEELNVEDQEILE